MKNLKDNYQPYAVIIGAFLFILFNVYHLDFSDLSFSNEKNKYWSIIAMIILIIAMIVTIKFDPKNNNSTKQ